MKQLSTCRPELVQAYADGELSLSEALGIENHLETCATCAQSWRNQKALSAAIAENSLYYKAPQRLLDRLEAELPIHGQSSAGPVRAIDRRRPETLWRALSLAASAAFLIVLGASIFTRLGLPSAPDRTMQDVLSDHIRSLMVNHLADVASTDQHTVKPWFNGKVNFSPPVEDFAAEGFPLIGGRIDVVNDQPVAALVYRRKKHYINLFIWPSSRASEPEQFASQRGYNLIHWTQSGMDYWAVSDASRDGLEDFVKLARSGR